jgi:GTP-binding protein
MKSLCFERAVFIKSVVSWGDLPPANEPEVALVGRSNAGKSSALNILANRTRLAYVSKMPGRTQALNYFTLPKGGYIVDLPGYGFAKTAKATKMDWGPLLGRYIAERTPLTGVVMLMDIRLPLTDLDLGFLEWYAPTKKPLLVLLTKSDKVSNQVKIETRRKVQAHLEADGWDMAATQVLTFSTLKRIGLVEASDVISSWLPDGPVKKPEETS